MPLLKILKIAEILSYIRFFWTFRKKTQAQKTQGWKNSREFSEKLKPFLEKLKILPTQLDNIWDPKKSYY